MGPGILTVTMNPAVDLCLATEEFRPEGKTRAWITGEGPGGGGVNVARAIRRLGGESEAVVLVGGPTGERLRRLLDKEGVGHIDLPIAEEIRRNFLIFERASNRRFHFVVPGPRLSESEWRSVLGTVEERLNDAAFLVASGSLPPGAPNDLYGRMAQIARRRDARLILDTSGSALPAALGEGVFLVKPNHREFEQLAGGPVPDEASREEVAQRLVREGGAKVVVVTLGSQGALAVWEDGQTRVPAPSIDPKSQVGAGDSFTAALTLGLARGWELPDAVAYGAAAAGAALLQAGAELCTREDTERLFRELAGKPLPA